MSDLAKTRFDRLARLVPCAGAGFAGATAGGFLLMGENPEPDASIPEITRATGPAITRTRPWSRRPRRSPSTSTLVESH